MYYRNYITSSRVGLDAKTCREIERYFANIATAMDELLSAIIDPPLAAQVIFKGYEHAHASWSMDWGKPSQSTNDVMMQLWHHGNAGSWFLSEENTPWDPGDGSQPARKAVEYRVDELVHLAKLMRRLSQTYQGMTDQQASQTSLKIPAFDEKDALVFNLADLVKKKGRSVQHVVGIATAIHEWATGDPTLQLAQFKVAFRKWKNRP
jgi:hypothetical protein